MDALDLAAGLSVVGGGVLGGDAHAFQFELEEDLAAAVAGGEDGAVVAEHRCRRSEFTNCRVEEFDDVAGADGAKGVGAHEQAGVVVEEVEDFDGAGVGELPGSGVDLPGLVG